MAEQFVKSKLAPDKVVVFGKPGCPYCHKAVDLLIKLSVKVGHMEYVDLTERSDTNEIQNYFQKTTGAKTVPRIFIGDKCIGGYTDLEALYKSGELKTILEKIGAL